MNALDFTQPKDQTDKDYIIYQKGFHAGQSHTLPSPKTVEMFDNLIQTLNKLSHKMDLIDNTIHNPDTGLMFLLKEIKKQGEDNRDEIVDFKSWKSGIVAAIAILAFIIPSIFAYYVYKVDRINDQIVVLTSIANDK